MALLDAFMHLITRFRYPVSLPQDIAYALGIEIANKVRFPQMLSILTNPSCKATTLAKHMSRETAERRFQGALRKEWFGQKTLFSYYFLEGWLEFELQFDSSSCLRRVYIHHKKIPDPHGVELLLKEPQEKSSSLKSIQTSQKVTA